MISERSLNVFGYKLLNAKKVVEAIAIFKLNADLYPDSYNVYDSLGEAYMIGGETESAIQFYRKSLELNPENENARDKLEKLESGR